MYLFFFISTFVTALDTDPVIHLVAKTLTFLEETFEDFKGSKEQEYLVQHRQVAPSHSRDLTNPLLYETQTRQNIKGGLNGFTGIFHKYTDS